MKNPRPSIRPLIVIIVGCLFLLVLPLYFLWLQPRVYGRERITRLAIERNDPQLCMKVSIMSDTCMGWPCSRQDLCLVDVAAATKNIAACDQLGLSPSWSRQQRECYISLVGETDALSTHCEKIPDAYEKGKCFGKASAATEQPTNCDSLADKYAQKECYMTYIRTAPAVDVTVCANVKPLFNAQRQETAVTGCYMEVAFRTLDPKVCEKLERLNTIKWCKDEIQKKAAAGSGSASREWVSDLGRSFTSAHFTLSFDLPNGFDVKDSQNSIGVYRAPYVARAIGDDNSFMTLIRYNQYNTRESEIQRYKKLLKNSEESRIAVDGTPFLMLKGNDWGRFEGDSAGKVIAVFFDKSWLEIIERPTNADQNFDPLAMGEQILSTFRFSKE